ncbi:hypothetical protein D0T12_25800 [Actinomadura spongiicola]|uniref:Uncharacterized protein n=2 Tax=Actinomadura spongiicola TaxID=2303421 RepID=A0A372GBP8_9ACTN|nr:hypothetical protein D0T12_25800 [Actinomadura spongiicola]
MGVGAAVLTAGIPAASAAAAGPHCDPHNVAKIQSKKTYRKVSETVTLYNRTKDTVKREVKFEETRKTKWSVSGGVEGSLKAWIFAEIKVHVNAGLDKESTVTRGYKDTIKIRPRYKLTAQQGWEMQQAKGYVYHVYSNCKTQNRGGFTLNAPYNKYVSYKTTKL